MEKMKMESKDLVQEKMEKVAELFPGVITENEDEEGNLTRALDFDLLKQELSCHVVDGEKERYQLTWPGKKEAIALASLPIDKTLRPVEEESVDWETTENLYIEGDNLEALKILQESYLNSVKCIYIDPPYNTGNNFIYRDNFKQDKDEYMNDSGQVDDNGNRLFQNTESNGRFHSDWLSMMYPRLKLARNLLREDGVIFISIDDCEVHNIRKICDDIFGQNNFIETIVWLNKEGGGGSDSKYFRRKHEYIIVYAKNALLLTISGVDISNRERYTLKDDYHEERGPYYLQKLAQSSIQYSTSLDYAIQAPDGSDIFPGETNGKKNCYRWSKEKVAWGIKNGFIEFKKDKFGKWQVYSKQYLNFDNEGNYIERKNRPLALVEGYSTTQASKYLKMLFGAEVFKYSKPFELIKHILDLVTNNEDIAIDFFSGSATTAHAVMQLNAEDGGNRKYIMVQLPESCPEDSEAYRAGYQNISEIGKERIRRAANKIKEETGAEIDYGFRVFKVDSSNMKEVYYRPEELTQQQILETVSNIKEDRTGEDLLFQVMMDWGLGLSLPVRTKEIQGKDVHLVAGNSLVACFEEDVSEELIKEIAGIKPLRAVFRDSSFASDAERINLEEIFKMLSSGTEIKVI